MNLRNLLQGLEYAFGGHPDEFKGILFTIDGNDEVILCEDNGEVCPTLVYMDDYWVEPVTEFSSSDAEEFIDNCFTTKSFDVLWGN